MRIKLAHEKARTNFLCANLCVQVGGAVGGEIKQEKIVLVDTLKNAKSVSFALSIFGRVSQTKQEVFIGGWGRGA